MSVFLKSSPLEEERLAGDLGERIGEAVAEIQPGRVAAGGLTSGIDLALHIVERYYGQEVAQITADFLEYGGELWKSPEFNQVKPVVAAK